MHDDGGDDAADGVAAAAIDLDRPHVALQARVAHDERDDRPMLLGDEQPAVAKVERRKLADEKLQLSAVERVGDVVARDLVELRGDAVRYAWSCGSGTTSRISTPWRLQ